MSRWDNFSDYELGLFCKVADEAVKAEIDRELQRRKVCDGIAVKLIGLQEAEVQMLQRILQRAGSDLEVQTFNRFVDAYWTRRKQQPQRFRYAQTVAHFTYEQLLAVIDLCQWAKATMPYHPDVNWVRLQEVQTIIEEYHKLQD